MLALIAGAPGVDASAEQVAAYAAAHAAANVTATVLEAFAAALTVAFFATFTDRLPRPAATIGFSGLVVAMTSQLQDEEPANPISLRMITSSRSRVSMTRPTELSASPR